MISPGEVGLIIGLWTAAVVLAAALVGAWLMRRDEQRDAAADALRCRSYDLGEVPELFDTGRSLEGAGRGVAFNRGGK